MDPRDQFVLVKRLGHVVVRAKPESAHLVLDSSHARENENRCLDLRQTQGPQDFIAGHIRQVQIKQNDVVIIELTEIHALFAQIRSIDIEALGLQHQFNALCSCTVILDKQNAHFSPLVPPLSPSRQPRTEVRSLWQNSAANWLTNSNSYSNLGN